MNTIPYNKFKHGQRVTCDIARTKIDDARISIDRDGMLYICQNIKRGGVADDNLSYKYSWLLLGKNDEYYDGIEEVTNLKLPLRTLDDLEEGDFVVREEDDQDCKVLGICGKIVFISLSKRYDDVSDCMQTIKDLKECGYTLKQEEEKLEFRESTEAESKIIENPVLIINEDETQIRYKGNTYILSKYL